MSYSEKDESSWPSDLADLERRLAGRIRQEPAPTLRQDVCAAVARERARQEGEKAKRFLWRRFAAAAAAVLVWVNFSTSVVNNMNWRLRGDDGRIDIAAAAQHVRELAPELSADDARRQALLLHAGLRAAPAPYVRASLDRFLQHPQRELKPWDIH